MTPFSEWRTPNLPFTPEQTTYLSYWQEMAEIVYAGEGQTATYRKAPGIADVSGDSNDYTAETVIQAGGCSVALKGTGEAYVLGHLERWGLFLLPCLEPGHPGRPVGGRHPGR